jgi:hypothetical protein
LAAPAFAHRPSDGEHDERDRPLRARERRRPTIPNTAP